MCGPRQVAQEGDAMTDPRVEAETALMEAVFPADGSQSPARTIRAAYRAGIVAELRAVADNPSYRNRCVCHSCGLLHARIAELEAGG